MHPGCAHRSPGFSSCCRDPRRPTPNLGWLLPPGCCSCFSAAGCSESRSCCFRAAEHGAGAGRGEPSTAPALPWPRWLNSLLLLGPLRKGVGREGARGALAVPPVTSPAPLGLSPLHALCSVCPCLCRGVCRQQPGSRRAILLAAGPRAPGLERFKCLSHGPCALLAAAARPCLARRKPGCPHPPLWLPPPASCFLFPVFPGAHTAQTPQLLLLEPGRS